MCFPNKGQNYIYHVTNSRKKKIKDIVQSSLNSYDFLKTNILKLSLKKKQPL